MVKMAFKEVMFLFHTKDFSNSFTISVLKYLLDIFVLLSNLCPNV